MEPFHSPSLGIMSFELPPCAGMLSSLLPAPGLSGLTCMDGLHWLLCPLVGYAKGRHGRRQSEVGVFIPRAPFLLGLLLTGCLPLPKAMAPSGGPLHAALFPVSLTMSSPHPERPRGANSYLWLLVLEYYPYSLPTLSLKTLLLTSCQIIQVNRAICFLLAP